MKPLRFWPIGVLLIVLASSFLLIGLTHPPAFLLRFVIQMVWLLLALAGIRVVMEFVLTENRLNRFNDQLRRVATGQSQVPMLPSIIISVLIGAVFAVGVTTYLAWLVTGAKPWTRPGTSPNSVTYLDVIKVGLSVAAGIGGVVALVVAYRRQRHLEEDATGKRARFGAAAQQLGDSQPAVRLAGVYAMATLADAWATQRQLCVDTLCAYLRLPWVEESENAKEPETTTTEISWVAGNDSRKVTRTYAGRAGEEEVRRTITSVIASHLKPDAPTSWRDLNFDFTKAVLIDLDFRGLTFSGQEVLFRRSVFKGRATKFTETKFECKILDFEGAIFRSDEATFQSAVFRSPTTSFRSVDFANANFSNAELGGLEVNFDHSKFSGSRTNFSASRFTTPKLNFRYVHFLAELVDFGKSSFGDPGLKPRKPHASSVNFARSQFAGKRCSFQEARFESAAYFDEVWFAADVTEFDSADFKTSSDFERAAFSGVTKISFQRCSFTARPYLRHARFADSASYIFYEARMPDAAEAFAMAHFSLERVEPPNPEEE